MRALVLACVLVGCSHDDETATTPACGPGETLREDGACMPVGSSCAPGEWLRDSECIPAGVEPDGCGPGFMHDGDRGCDPILPGEPCAPGSMAVPGEMRCREVAPCARGKWGDIPVEPTTVYVDAAFAGTSDGSQAQPWTTIQEGVDHAPPGAIVAVTDGTYLEDVNIESHVRLWGVCPARASVVGTSLAAIFVRSGASGTELHRLGITGQGLGVIVFGSEDVLIEEAHIHDNQSRGVNLQGDDGAVSVTLRRCLLENNREQGVFVSGSEVHLEATVVRDTTVNAQGVWGRGLGVQDDPSIGVRALATVQGSLLERNHATGIFVESSDATVEATVIRDTQPDAQGASGRGIGAQNNPASGALTSITLRQSVLQYNRQIGVHVSGAQATLERTVVRDTLADGLGIGRGINVQDDPMTGASFTMRSSLVERNLQLGLFIEGSDAVVESSALRDTAGSPTGGGRGIQVQGDMSVSASLALRTSVLERSLEAGLGVYGPTVVEVDGCLVRDTLAGNGLYGDGLAILALGGRPSATVLATRIERSERAAISNFGSGVAIGDSTFVCQAFDLAAESLNGPAEYQDLGAVLCGCPTATEPCKAQSHALAPPDPLAGLD